MVDTGTGITAVPPAATTIMTDHAHDPRLLRLIAWLSPAFPVGSFAYSHGLECAVKEARVADAAGLQDWLEQMLRFGSGWNDAVLFAESWRRARQDADLTPVAELAEALAGSKERHQETLWLGRGFRDAASAWSSATVLPDPCAYCVAVGATAGAHGIGVEVALQAFLQAFASNLIQAAIRLGVCGQGGAVATLAALEPLLLETADRASASTLDDLGSATLLSDIMAMRHETQRSRLFRS